MKSSAVGRSGRHLFGRLGHREGRSAQHIYQIVVGLLLLICLLSQTSCEYGFAPSAVTPTSVPETCAQAYLAANPIAAENTCPGTNAWRPDTFRVDNQTIEGFTAPASVNAGGHIQLYVSTVAPTFRFEVYRMGWYQGTGARLMYSSALLKGIQQPKPLFDTTTHMVSCANWHDPISLGVPVNWVSGVYIVRMLASTGMTRYTIFVVRNDASHSPILFKASLFTWQAYNLWGHYDLYYGPQPGTPVDLGKLSPDTRSRIVSLDRPYKGNGGLGDFFSWGEYNILRWAERRGYDVSYETDMDADLWGQTLLQHQLILVAGHDEYWSTAMRQHVTAARDAGISLAFLGANDVYWHIRLQPSPLGLDREIVCYKATDDPMAGKEPTETTVRWRESPVNQPENTLLGGMYAGIVTDNWPLVLASGAEQFANGTALHAGSSLPGLVGGEYDRIVDNGLTPSNLKVVAESPIHCPVTSLCPNSGVDTSMATLYTASSGAKVFDAGTFFWGWGLDDDGVGPLAKPHTYSSADFQKFTANLFAYLLAR